MRRSADEITVMVGASQHAADLSQTSTGMLWSSGLTFTTCLVFFEQSTNTWRCLLPAFLQAEPALGKGQSHALCISEASLRQPHPRCISWGEMSFHTSLSLSLFPVLV